MNTKRRTDTEIKRDILKTVDIRTGVTKIVYGCNLNFNIVRRHLNKLIKKGLISRDVTDSRTLYTLTDKGAEIIPILDQTIQSL